MDRRSRISTFLRDEILIDSGSEDLREDTPLLKGMIDSVGLMHLIVFLEEEFGIEIDEGEVVPDNFRTVADIAHLVERRIAS